MKDNELVEMRDTINKTLLETRSNMYIFEKNLLMGQNFVFEAKDSKEFGQLIVTQIFNYFQLAEGYGQFIKMFTNRATCVEQIEDFRKIITCSDDRTIKIWSTESGECLKILTGHSEEVQSLMISNDKKYLISGSKDKTVKVWNIENDFECIQTLVQELGFNSFCLLPNNILVCGSYFYIIKWNLNNFTKKDSFFAHGGDIWDLKHVSSSQVASCSSDKTIKLWNLMKNECLRTFTGHTDEVKRLEISPDKSNLISGSDDKTVRVWGIYSGVCLKTIDFGSRITSFKLLSSDLLAIGLNNTEESLKIIDLKTLEIVKSCKSQSLTVSCLNFDSKNNVLFTGSNSEPVSMWQL
jgi:WD40 repeat protein